MNVVLIMNDLSADITPMQDNVHNHLDLLSFSMVSGIDIRFADMAYDVWWDWIERRRTLVRLRKELGSKKQA